MSGSLAMKSTNAFVIAPSTTPKTSSPTPHPTRPPMTLTPREPERVAQEPGAGTAVPGSRMIPSSVSRRRSSATATANRIGGVITSGTSARRSLPANAWRFSTQPSGLAHRNHRRRRSRRRSSGPGTRCRAPRRRLPRPGAAIRRAVTSPRRPRRTSASGTATPRAYSTAGPTGSPSGDERSDHGEPDDHAAPAERLRRG